MQKKLKSRIFIGRIFYLQGILFMEWYGAYPSNNILWSRAPGAKRNLQIPASKTFEKSGQFQKAIGAERTRTTAPSHWNNRDEFQILLPPCPTVLPKQKVPKVSVVASRNENLHRDNSLGELWWLELLDRFNLADFYCGLIATRSETGNIIPMIPRLNSKVDTGKGKFKQMRSGDACEHNGNLFYYWTRKKELKLGREQFCQKGRTMVRSIAVQSGLDNIEFINLEDLFKEPFDSAEHLYDEGILTSGIEANFLKYAQIVTTVDRETGETKKKVVFNFDKKY